MLLLRIHLLRCLLTEPEADSRSLYWFLKLLKDSSGKSMKDHIQQCGLPTAVAAHRIKPVTCKEISELKGARTCSSSDKCLKNSFLQPIFPEVHMHICATSAGTWTLKFVFLPAKKRNIYIFWSCPRNIRPGLRGKLSFGNCLLLLVIRNSSGSNIWVDVFPKGNLLPNLLRMYVGSYNLGSDLS